MGCKVKRGRGAYHGKKGRQQLEERRKDDDGESLYRAWWLQATKIPIAFT